MLGVLLAATLLLWITATILVQAQQSTVRSVRGTTAPELLDAVAAHAAWPTRTARHGRASGPARPSSSDPDSSTRTT